MKSLNPFPESLFRNHSLKVETVSAFVVILFFGGSLFFWTFLFQGKLPAVTDTMMHLYPDRIFNASQFLHGIIPLWNPLVGCGIPQEANWLSACFYPLSWLWYLLGKSGSLVSFCLLHAGLAFLGFYLWLRTQSVSPLWSLLGALSFANSALFTRCWGYPNHIAALAFIPWIFWSAQQAVKKKGLPRWALLSMLLGFQLLAGYPIFSFYTFLFLGIWFLFQLSTPKDRWLLGFSILAALGLSAVQWIPFLEFLTYAVRGGWWKDFPYYTRPVEYLTLLNPGILGVPGSSQYWGTPANFVFNLYFGLVPLAVLVTTWFLMGKKKAGTFFWSFSALLWLLWMAGAHFPPWKILPENMLQGLEPSKSVSLFIFCAVTCAALAINRWSLGWNPIRRPFWIFFIALAWTADMLGVPFQLTHPVTNPYRETELVMKAEKMRRSVGSGRMLGLSTGGQFSFSGPDSVENSVKKPVQRFLADTNEAWDIRSASYYLSIWPESLNNLSRYTFNGFPYLGDLLDIAGVRLFFLPQPLPPPKYKAVEEISGNFVSLNSQASEDMRWVPGVTELPDRPSILNILAHPNSGWRDRVYLEQKSDGSLVGLTASLRELKGFAASGYQRPAASHASWVSDFGKAGYLVFNESFAPGWRAWVDLKPVGILRAYGLFMAVPVAKDARQVDFRYEPASFRLGLFLSLLACCSLATGFLKRVFFPT